METKRISALPNVVNAAAGRGDEPAVPNDAARVLDVAFLAQQTVGDEALEREVLGLFVAQAERLVPRLLDVPHRDRLEAAHLLKGSARGIGAWDAADAADAYETATPATQSDAYLELAAAFARVQAAIAVHLAGKSA